MTKITQVIEINYIQQSTMSCDLESQLLIEDLTLTSNY